MALSNPLALLLCLLVALLPGTLTSNSSYASASTTDDDDLVATAPSLEVCDDGVIKISAIDSLCDSPYTFYYGNGANRNSVVCKYGDKVTITVQFDVLEDLGNMTIYVVQYLYAGYGNELLSLTSPKTLESYVGFAVNSTGTYSFTYSTTGGSYSRSSEKFLPYWQIAFSSEEDGGYNLGSANIPCDWDKDEKFDWSEIVRNRTKFHFNLREFAIDYGILIATILVVVIYISYLYHVVNQDLQGSENDLEEGNSKKVSLIYPPPKSCSRQPKRGK